MSSRAMNPSLAELPDVCITEELHDVPLTSPFIPVLVVSANKFRHYALDQWIVVPWSCSTLLVPHSRGFLHRHFLVIISEHSIKMTILVNLFVDQFQMIIMTRPRFELRDRQLLVLSIARVFYPIFWKASLIFQPTERIFVLRKMFPIRLILQCRQIASSSQSLM